MCVLTMVQIGLMVGAEVVNLLTAPGDPRYGAELNDMKVSASTYGKTIQWGAGVQRIPGNMIWAAPLKQYEHAGKGLGQSTYSYNWTGCMGLCEGPIVDVLQIWADTKIVFDKTGEFGADLCHQNAGTYPNPLKFTVYNGTEEDMPDPDYVALVGEANATGNRGMAKVVFHNIPITNYGNRVPNYTFVVAFQNASTQAFTVRDFDIKQGTSSATPSETLAFQDWTRQRAYFRVSAPAEGITYCDMNTGETIYSNTSANIFAGFPDGEVSVLGFMIPGLDGNVYCMGSGNFVMKVDGDALVCTGQFTTTGFPYNGIPVQIAGINFLTYVQQTGTIGVFCTDTMTVLPGTSHTTIAPTDDNTYIGPGSLNQATSGEPYAYLFKIGQSNTDTVPLNLYQLDVIGSGDIYQSLIGTVSPSQVNPAWNHITSIAGLAFDQSDGNIIFGVENTIDTMPAGASAEYVIKVSVTSGNILWATTVNALPFFAPAGDEQDFTLNAITDGQYCFLGNAGASYVGAGDASASGYRALYLIDTTDGSFVRENWPSTTNQFHMQTYDGNHGTILYWGNLNPDHSADQWLLLYTDRAAAAAVPLEGVVSELCQKVGLSTAQIDVTRLASSSVDGYAIGSIKSAADAIKPLAVAYQFDSAESDGKIVFVPRGGASVVSIPASSLGYIDNKTNAVSKETRVQEVDLARTLSVAFFDPNHDYQKAYQYSQRSRNPVPSMFSNNRKEVSLDLVLEPNEAKQLADKILYSSWAERVSYQFKLPWEFLVLDPTDVVTYTLSDNSVAVTRTVDMHIGADLSSEINACGQDSETYSSNSTTDGGATFPQNKNPSWATKVFLFDAPLLRDLDDTGFTYTLMYWAAGAYASGWNGVELWKSLDSVAYTDQDGVSESATWGVCISALGDTAHPFATDNVNSLTVALTVGSANLASCTNLQMLNGSNAAAIWNLITGAIEIIQFQNVTANADGSFTLSKLLRGRRGSEVYTGTHAIGDYFVLLTTSAGAVATGVQTDNISLSDCNRTEFWKGVPTGTLLANALQMNFNNSGRTMKPYAPVHLKAATSGSDLALSWVRRTRVYGHEVTGTVPLAEQDEHYSVDIYDAPGTTVLRTIDVDYHSITPTATPGVTYTAAQITADFGSTPTSLNMIVYQIGALGRGFGKMYNVLVDGPPTP